MVTNGENKWQAPVKKLDVYNFRNIKNLSFSPGQGLNIIYGDNAKGKTNLIESIWMFTGEKSFRRATESQLILLGEQKARIDLDFFAEQRTQKATIKWLPKKEVYLNSCKAEKLIDFIGKFSAIVFSPEDLTLVKGSPRNRRGFLDIALSQVKPKYTNLMLRYNKILMQRNTLLKDSFKYPELLETLDIWDDVFAKLVTNIMIYRLKYIKVLTPILEELYGNITEKKEKLDIKYVTNSEVNFDMDFDFMKNYFYEKIKKTRNLDIKFGYTQIGPHRDDFDITIGGLPVKTFASQGQQRSVVLALKLAEAEVLRTLVNKNPVILLDDVMSELDFKRKKYILNYLKDTQCFITCCDENYFKDISYPISLYKIDDLLEL